MRLFTTSLLALLLACSCKTTSSDSAATTTSSSSQEPVAEASAAEATEETEPVEASEPTGPQRTDLSALDPAYPATILLPEGVEATVEVRTTKTDGLGVIEAILEISLGPKRSVFASVNDDRTGKANERTELAKSSDAVFNMDGPEGSWAIATKGYKCSLLVVVPAHKMSCYKEYVPCDDTKILAEACLSLQRTDDKLHTEQGGAIAFPELENQDGAQAAYEVARAIIDEDLALLSKHWNEKQKVKVARKGVNRSQLQAAVSKAGSISKFLNLPCEPGSGACDFDAVLENKTVNLFLHTGYESVWDIYLKKNRDGVWEVKDVSTTTETM